MKQKVTLEKLEEDIKNIKIDLVEHTNLSLQESLYQKITILENNISKPLEQFLGYLFGGIIVAFYFERKYNQLLFFGILIFAHQIYHRLKTKKLIKKSEKVIEKSEKHFKAYHSKS